jgi:hypothetical protein
MDGRAEPFNAAFFKRMGGLAFVTNTPLFLANSSNPVLCAAACGLSFMLGKLSLSLSFAQYLWQHPRCLPIHPLDASPLSIVCSIPLATPTVSPDTPSVYRLLTASLRSTPLHLARVTTHLTRFAQARSP